MSSSRYKVNPLVVVGVPTLQTRPLSWEWMHYFKRLGFGLGVSAGEAIVRGRPVAEARNEIVSTALASDATYVLFISDDVLAPPNTFELLHRHREMMVTGVYWTKGHPTQPYLWNGFTQGPYVDWTLGEYFPIDWAGCDCLLVHTDVFRAIEPPWFSHEWVYEAGARRIPLATEDLYFYSKARKAGFQLYCDTEAQCDHQDRETGVRYGLTKEMPQYLRSIGQRPPPDPGRVRVADLGAGFETPWFGAEAEIVRFDGSDAARPDVRCDLRAIPMPDESFDIIHARHVLEHFMHTEAPLVLREWLRILKVGGEARVIVPNLAFAAQEILKADADPDYDATLYPLYQLYGHQVGNPGELHRNGFSRHGLARLLAGMGLADVRVEVTGESGENLSATARKVAADRPYVVTDDWRDDAADLPVPGLPGDARLNGAHIGELALAGRTKASDD